METLTRKERRAEMRSIIKELGAIKNNRVFKEAMSDETFARLAKENIVQLRDGTYTDKNTLFRYGAVISLLQNANALEERLHQLRTWGIKQ